MLTVSLMGGLGNQLFQIAAGQFLASTHGRGLRLPPTPKTHHSDADYFKTILRGWADVVGGDGPWTDQHERSYAFQEWTLPETPVRLCGYFQNHRYIPPDFVSHLTLPSVPVLPGAFLHIRGGDYVNHPYHDVKLEAYYRRAVEMFPPGTTFFVFTNDVSYAKSLSWLSEVPHTFVDEPDEVRSLALMAQCRDGGICANSTFSWWGAYLNREGRTLVLPSKWFNDPGVYLYGYFFPGCIVCQV